MMTFETYYCETCETETPHYRATNHGWAPDVWVCENYDGAPDYSDGPVRYHATVEA